MAPTRKITQEEKDALELEFTKRAKDAFENIKQWLDDEIDSRVRLAIKQELTKIFREMGRT